MTSDDLIGTVKAALDELAASDKSDGKYSGAELRRKAKALAGVQEPAEDWLRALLARCEAAEDERDAARAENAELWKGLIPSNWLAMHAADKRLYEAARAEVARLRDARADDVALVARLSQQVVALRDAVARVLDGPHYIDRDYQDVLLAALDTPAREGGEG